MANRSEGQSETPNRSLISLVVLVALVGTFLAWWGTRDDRHLFGEPLREPVAAAASPVLQSIQRDSAQLARGSQIERRECAGCHEMRVRLSAPSYEEILALYRRQAGPEGSPELLSKLAVAVAHPQPGWTNFAPGPAEPGLVPEDRLAVASWILQGSVQKRDPSEGTR